MDDLRGRLWKAANKLRGQLDAAAYKHVVLALLFLRMVPRSPLVCPPEATWDRLGPGRLDAAFDAVERANPELRGALPRGLDELERVDELLALFGDAGFLRTRDELGQAYEFFLKRFARAEGRRGGQFYTPACVVELLKGMLGPIEGTVYDPCFGSGGMFLRGGAVAGAFGQESNPKTWRLARMSLALHGVDADLGARPADSFLDDQHRGRRADVVLANPPFNQSEWGFEALRDDPCWRFGIPPAGNANYAWLQHVLSHVAPGGRAGVVLANGALSVARAGQAEIRRALVEAGWIDAMVALPPRLFFATPIPASVWILSQERPEKTLFIDARGLGRPVDRSLCELDPETIIDCYRAYESRPGLARVVTREEIAGNDHVLSPGRYVAPARDTIDEPARDRLRRLRDEWSELATDSDELTREIREIELGL